MSHSLVREHGELMREVADGTMRVQIQLNTRTGEADHRIQMEFPPEEALESLAARLRPLILDSEDIHYSKVFDAIEDLVGADKLDEIVDVQWWRAFWSERVDGSLAAQAYYMTTDNGTVTDRRLMYSWLYSDLVHGTCLSISGIRPRRA
jgi:hypothetical protein